MDKIKIFVLVLSIVLLVSCASLRRKNYDAGQAHAEYMQWLREELKKVKYAPEQDLSSIFDNKPYSLYSNGGDYLVLWRKPPVAEWHGIDLNEGYGMIARWRLVGDTLKLFPIKRIDYYADFYDRSIDTVTIEDFYDYNRPRILIEIPMKYVVRQDSLIGIFRGGRTGEPLVDEMLSEQSYNLHREE